MIDQQPLASETSTAPTTTDAIKAVVVDRQPEPTSKVVPDFDGPYRVFETLPSSPPLVKEPVEILRPGFDVDSTVAVVMEKLDETEIVEEKVISEQPPSTLHDEIQKLQVSVEKSLSTSGERDKEIQSKTLLEQAQIAIASLDVSQYHNSDDGGDSVVFGDREKSTTTTTTTSSQERQHQVTYDGCDEDEDSVIQRIRNQDKKIVEQIRKENEHNPEWLKGIVLF